LLDLVKEKLTNGLSSIEEDMNIKLRGKVEIDKLNEMSNTISNKFNAEINSKLDKKELKMRTTVINKKVNEN